MTPARIKALVVLGVLAAVDLAATTHAIVTRHVPHTTGAKATTAATAPTVMSVGSALGCLTSFLLLVLFVCVIIDARWTSQRPKQNGPPGPSGKII